MLMSTRELKSVFFFSLCFEVFTTPNLQKDEAACASLLPPRPCTPHPRPIRWLDVSWSSQAKAKLRQAVEWPAANKAAFDRMGLTPPR